MGAARDRPWLLNSVKKCMCEALTMHQRTGMCPSNILILILLGENEYLRVTEIAELVGFSQQAIGKNLKVLAADELIAIEVDPEDARAKHVSITYKGVDKLAMIAGKWR